MLKEERQQIILQILNKEEKVIASDLSIRLSVSEDTIRRDLKELDKKGFIKRVHSGALKTGPPIVDFSIRQEIFHNTKAKLAEKALHFIKENQTIIIDGGTTNLHLATQLPLTLKSTIITNSPPIATALSHHSNINIIMLGGELFKQSMVNLGITTAELLNTIRADLYIMGVYNMHPISGISVPSLSEALVKNKMSSHSQKTIALSTPDKLHSISNYVVSKASAVSYLITDKIDPELKKQYEDKQITIID